MVQLLELPVDLLHEVADHVDDPNDLASLARVNHFFHSLADKRIWKLANRQHRYGILMWACATGNAPALRRLLRSGFTTNLNFQLHGHISLEHITSDFYLSIRHDLWVARHKEWCASDREWIAIPYMDDFYVPAAPQLDRYERQFWKPLHAAVYHGQGHIVETLLQHGAWVDAIATNYHGCDRPGSRYMEEPGHGVERCTPLHVALSTGQEEIARTLISNGASMYVNDTVYRWQRKYDPNRKRITALHLCGHHGLLSTARYLVEQGYQTEIDELDEPGYSPIMYAYASRHDDVFYYLLAQGANTRFTGPDWSPVFDPDSRSILHQACRDRRWEIFVKLVEHGCDVHEPDGRGDTPLEICLKHYVQTFMMREMTVSGMNRDAQEMIKAIEKYGMHEHLDQGILVSAACHALSWAVPPLLSFALARGLDISTLLWSGGMSGIYPPHRPEPREYFIDTGLYGNQLTLIEFACYDMKPSAHLEEIIDILLARGCIQAGDIDSYVCVLKNLCCRGYNWGDCSGDPTQLHCVQKICSHLTSTVSCDTSRPKLPVALFFICLEKCQRDVLDEMLKVFDFPDMDFSEYKMECFLRALVNDTWDQAVANRRLQYLELVFEADKQDYLLRCEDTFRLLYEAFLKVDGGEKAILDYLDRGGRYSLFPDRAPTSALYAACESNCLQLAERLIDMGAYPRNLITCDGPFSLRPTHRDLWGKNSGDVAILRLLIERGADPFPTNELEDPFDLHFYCHSDKYLEFFQTLCELTVNKKTDEKYLLAMLKIACKTGKHTGVLVLRSCARRKVDALIRDKAAFFLQTLLAYLYQITQWCEWDRRFIKEVDESIDLIQLILELGPANTLTSRWRLGKMCDYQPRSALELLEKMLTPPENPHPDGDSCWICLQGGHGYLYRIYWCLDQRINIDMIKGKPQVTVKGRTITRPSQLHDPRVPADEAEWDLLEEIPLPRCYTCEPPYDPYR
ncbi:hypothetical protein PG993_004293 [Apiospora rasikravindrae]|uniref:F-box domain-containing protein n=1 Tax=Apiospora rasikravindrae TaxID=990691 RepID=A0ABR1TES0_9PEZI